MLVKVYRTHRFMATLLSQSFILLCSEEMDSFAPCKFHVVTETLSRPDLSALGPLWSTCPRHIVMRKPTFHFFEHLTRHRRHLIIAVCKSTRSIHSPKARGVSPCECSPHHHFGVATCFQCIQFLLQERQGKTIWHIWHEYFKHVVSESKS